MRRVSRNWVGVFLLLLGLSGRLVADPERFSTVLPNEWLGAWQEKDQRRESLLNIEPERIIQLDGTGLTVRGVIRREGEVLVLRNQGLKVEWRVTQLGSALQAALMAKHTDDLRLLMTILPQAEDDFRTAGKGQTYAILYDALQLDLGLKQRYGTQVQEDASGQPFVLPLEDPTRVDDYLKELGLPSFEDYRAQISRAVFSGKPVQIWPEDGR